MLLVEDNKINQLVTVRMLEKRGFRVDVATNGRVALEMCQRRRYAAIFMDCHMPEVDGYKTAAEIRRREGTDRHVPIIAMTANTMQGAQEKCLSAGMDDYIAKPVDPEALNDAITRAMTANRLRPNSENRVSGEVHETKPAHSGRAPLLDRSTLDGLCEGDTQMHQDLVNHFTDESQAFLADLARAIQIRDAETLQHDAHHLKGSSVSVGALRMAALCDRLGEAGRAGLLSDAPGLLQELQRASELTRAAWYAEPPATVPRLD